jgi:hypothetical protein
MKSMDNICLDTMACEIEALAAEKSLDAVQKHLLVGIEQALMEHVVRAGVD